MMAMHKAQWVWSALLALLLLRQHLAKLISKEALYVELARQARAELAAMPHLSTHSSTAHFRSVIAKGFVRHGHSASDVEVRGLPTGFSCSILHNLGNGCSETPQQTRLPDRTCTKVAKHLAQCRLGCIKAPVTVAKRPELACYMARWPYHKGLHGFWFHERDILCTPSCV